MTRDGVSIFVRAWLPEQPQHILVCVQGLGGHGGYYEGLAGQLAPRGTITVAPDLRGHGRSCGPRGDIDRFDRYLQDIDAAVTWASACWPSIPLFVLGESMGASLAIQYVVSAAKPAPIVTKHHRSTSGFRTRSQPQRHIIPPALAGLVLVSPVLSPAIRPTIHEIMQYISSLLVHPSHPSLAVTGREEPGCRDAEFNAYLRADPLFVRLVSVRFLTQLTLWLWRTRKKAHLLDLPLLVLQGGQDKVANANGTTAFLRHVPSREKRIITFPQAYHSLLHDPDTPLVVKALSSWLAISSES
jgi:alpha-beta hydrolase superfamily lysophospholipase